MLSFCYHRFATILGDLASIAILLAAINIIGHGVAWVVRQIPVEATVVAYEVAGKDPWGGEEMQAGRQQ